MAASTTQPRRSSADSGPRTRAKYLARHDSLQRQNSASELADRWSRLVPSRRCGRRTGASIRGSGGEVVMCAPCRRRGGREVGSGSALIEQRSDVVWVLVDDPGDEVGDALSGRVRNHPELEVLGAVVEAESVLVVHELV